MLEQWVTAPQTQMSTVHVGGKRGSRVVLRLVTLVKDTDEGCDEARSLRANARIRGSYTDPRERLYTLVQHEPTQGGLSGPNATLGAARVAYSRIRRYDINTHIHICVHII